MGSKYMKTRQVIGKTVTYTFTEKQLQEYRRKMEEEVRQKISKELTEEKNKLTREAINTAFILLLSLPVKVLFMKYGWRGRKRLPEFANAICDEYEEFCEGNVTLEEYKKLVEDLTGIGFTTDEELAEECPI